METLEKHLAHEIKQDSQFLNLKDLIDHDYRALMAGSLPDVYSRVSSALKNAVNLLCDQPNYGVIGCHLTLYDARTQVFHSPIHAEDLRSTDGKALPDRVILLVDDIFDMHDRLSGSGDIFDQQQAASSTLENLLSAASRAEVSINFDVDDPAGDDKRRVLADLDAQTSALQRLLSWRRAEMVAAESLARELGVPLLLFGVKHPLESGGLALSKDAKPAVYISHPITRHRVEQRVSGEWSTDVTSLNRLPMELARRGLVAIMPTAIDELRFSPPAGPDLFVKSGASTDRWPCMESDYGLISPRYQPGQNTHVSYGTEAFAVDPVAASLFCRSLESSIYWEIPFRDHYIVNHTDGLLVFRPQELGHSFSGGVLAEIQFFERLARQSQRRMVVIHDTDDLDPILSRLGEGSFFDEGVIERVGEEYLRANAPRRLHREITRAEASSMLHRGKIQTSQLSAPTFSPTELSDFVRDSWIAAGEVALFVELSGLEAAAGWCRILIGDTSSTSVLTHASAWLGSTDLINPVETLLHDIGEQDDLGTVEFTERLIHIVAISLGVTNPPF